MKPGASTIAFRQESLDATLLQKMKEYGVDTLELTDYHLGFDYADSAAFTALLQALDSLEMDVYTLHAHLLYLDPACDLTASGTDQRSHLLASYRQAIDAFALLGGGIMVTHDIAIPDSSSPDHEQKRGGLIQNLAEICDYAGEHGVRIAIENLTNGYFSDPANLIAVVDEIAVDNLGICIDTGHRNMHGDPAEALRLVGDRLYTVHIHDNHGAKDEHLLPTRGTIDWSATFGALSDIHYSGVFVYELSRGEDVAQVPQNYAQISA